MYCNGPVFKPEGCFGGGSGGSPFALDLVKPKIKLSGRNTLVRHNNSLVLVDRVDFKSRNWSDRRACSPEQTPRVNVKIVVLLLVFETNGNYANNSSTITKFTKIPQVLI